MSMDSDDWKSLGKQVGKNVVQKSSVEGVVGAAASTAIASGQPEAQIAGGVVMGLWSLWKFFFNHKK